MADPEIVDLLRKAVENPTYQALTKYLMQRRAMPEIKQSYMGATSGQFSYGTSMPPAGLLQIANTQAPAAQNTLLHELTHAANRQITNQYYERQRGGSGASQFTDAYNKLQFMPGFDPADKHRDTQLVKSLPGGESWLDTKRDYRASDTERPAFAVGNSAAATNGQLANAPPHIDPTIATDFLTLLQTAIADMAKNPGPQGR